MGPYQVSPSLWLSPVVLSDTDEVYRILNIDESIHYGLYSSKMRFPFPREEAQQFTTRHLEKRTQSRVCGAWAIRGTVDGPMIGLFALDDFDHGDMGPCFRGGRGLEEAVATPIASAASITTTTTAATNTTSTTTTTTTMNMTTATTGTNGRGGETLKCGGFGYWMSPEHQGKGIMTEVVRFALTRMARQEFGYERIHGEAWTDNMGSRRVMERTGLMRPAVGVPVYVAKFGAVKDIAHYIYDTAKQE